MGNVRAYVLLAAVCASAIAACVQPGAVDCGGYTCPAKTVCDQVHSLCVQPAQLEACTGKATGDACSFGRVADAKCRDGVCLYEGCGNSLPDPGEECDDGNTRGGDGCSADCSSNELCGNGIRDTSLGEACDDGNEDDTDACGNDCAPPACGDGTRDVGEVCDDGNRVAGDGCNARCTSTEVCGNSIIDPAVGETCDDGGAAMGDGCNAMCQIEACGNGTIDTVLGEVCDDGNNVPTDNCSADCRSNNTCNNGIVDVLVGESCEDGNAAGGDGCSATCHLEFCGNGILDMGETCDPSPGNTVSGDGCSADCTSNETCGNSIVDAAAGEECDPPNGSSCKAGCKIAVCGDGMTDAGLQEECDMGAANSDAPGATCSTTCRLHRCGDGIKEVSEACDDNNTVSGDNCSGDCMSLEVCGNGITDYVRDEQCDDADTDAGDGCDGVCRAETATWELARAGVYDIYNGQLPRGPEARIAPAMTFDASTGRTVLFGGFGVVHGVTFTTTWFDTRNDTWEWDGNSWIERAVGAAAPPVRSEHAMAYLPSTRRTVMFGGKAIGGLDDTWEWDGRRWAQLGVGVAPTARWAHSLTAFGRDRLVLFGGRTTAGALDDTWEWNGSQWQQKSPGSPPPARYDHAIAYDPVTGRAVMFGGRTTAGAALSDTWEWTGSAWVLRSPTTVPAARYGHALVYDAARGKIVMLGGTDGSVNFDENWEWSGGNWVKRTNTTGPGDAREQHALAYDSARARTIVFGGSTHEGAYVHGTLEYDGSAWTQVSRIAPTPNERLGLATYSTGGRVIAFGGVTYVAGAQLYPAETWEWNGQQWWQRVPAASPPGRVSPAMADDPAHSTLLLFGGSTASALSDTWEWNGTTWTQRAPATVPTALTAMAFGYDAGRSVNVLVGKGAGSGIETWEWNGTDWSPRTPATTTPPAGTWSNRSIGYHVLRSRIVLAQEGGTWEWDGTDWSARSAMDMFGSESPLIVWDAARQQLVWVDSDVQIWDGSIWTTVSSSLVPMTSVVAYDPISQRVLLVFVDTSYGIVDTWAWNGTTWTKLTAHPSSPQPLSDLAMAYDARRAVAVLFGGMDDQNKRTAETWEWNGSWTLRAPATSPPIRSRHAMAYDGTRGMTVLFGGGTSASAHLGDTWEWDGATWTQKTPATSPSARQGHLMAFDAARGKAVLFGGTGSAGALTDTWEWDGTTWTQKTPATAPPYSAPASMTYDVARQRIVLVENLTGNLAQVWEWNGTTWTQISPATSVLAGGALAYHPPTTRSIMVSFFGTSTWDGTTFTTIEPPGALARQNTALVYHAARRESVQFGGTASSPGVPVTVGGETWVFGYQSAAQPESCRFGIDRDGDGKVGCADAECQGLCDPLCVTQGTCATGPRCGDGTCSSIESCRLCPGDCGACTATCGNTLCETGESIASCPGDCP